MVAETTFIVLGILCIALFAYINLYIQPKWYPNELAARNGVITLTALPAGQRQRHLFVSIVMAVMFFVGVAMVTVGCVMIGTELGYGPS